MNFPVLNKYLYPVFTAARNLLIHLSTLLLIIYLKRYKQEKRPFTLLLIRLDAIGDYVMFRNFIEILKMSPIYQGYSITFCGNESTKDLAERFDKDMIKEFIWINRLKFLHNISYRYKIMKLIYSKGFEVAIETIHSREILFGDSIILASQAHDRIGTTIVERYSKLKKRFFSDRWYTKLIPVSEKTLFEFCRTTEYFSHLLKTEIILKKPYLNTSFIKFPVEIKNKYVVLFPGASRLDKIWNIKNYRTIADFILNNYPYDIVVSGSPEEKEYAGGACPAGMEKRFFNLCGQPLSYLPNILSEAELLISNDTSSVHFAVAVDTPFICIANGFSFGRFYPYPKEIFSDGEYVYPDGSTPGKTANINDILPSDIIPIISDKLNVK